MRRFERLAGTLVLSASMCAVFFLSVRSESLESGSTAVSKNASSVGGCDDPSAQIESVPSHGRVNVPLTIEPSVPGKSLEAISAINRQFRADDVEIHVLDGGVDMPSAARLLVEFRCWGTWKRQHDFYRKVARESSCAYLRFRAVQLLEFDVCSPATVEVLIREYRMTAFAEEKEYIVRKLGMSRDPRAVAVVKEAIASKIRPLAKAALEGKEFGEGQACSPQPADAYPYVGAGEVAEVCDQNAPSAKAGGNSTKEGPTKDGGAESVDFGKH